MDYTRLRGLRVMFKTDEWLSADDAMFRLAVMLGLMDVGDYPLRAKHVFWSRDPIGQALFEFLEKLAELEILQRNEYDEFRWNGSFVGSWEPDLVDRLAQLGEQP